MRPQALPALATATVAENGYRIGQRTLKLPSSLMGHNLGCLLSTARGFMDRGPVFRWKCKISSSHCLFVFMSSTLGKAVLGRVKEQTLSAHFNKVCRHSRKVTFWHSLSCAPVHLVCKPTVSKLLSRMEVIPDDMTKKCLSLL